MIHKGREGIYGRVGVIIILFVFCGVGSVAGLDYDDTVIASVRTESGDLTTETIQYIAVLNKPVKWEKNIKTEEEREIRAEIPKQAEDVTLYKIVGGVSQKITADVVSGETLTEIESVDKKQLTCFLNKFFNFITEEDMKIEVKKEIKEVVIDEGAFEFDIKYETPAPIATETETSYGKQIIVSSEVHYANIQAYTELPEEVPGNLVKLYHIVDGTRKPVDIKKHDLDNDSLIELVEWLVPSLSSQTYELVIRITKAEHLDENRETVGDVYEEVRAKDGRWAKIPVNHYLRVSFEKPLNEKKDITIYARGSGESTIEVYEQDSDVKFAEFRDIGGEGWYKIYLMDLNGTRSGEVRLSPSAEHLAYKNRVMLGREAVEGYRAAEVEVEDNTLLLKELLDNLKGVGFDSLEEFETASSELDRKELTLSLVNRQLSECDTFDLKIVGGGVEFDYVIKKDELGSKSGVQKISALADPLIEENKVRLVDISNVSVKDRAALLETLLTLRMQEKIPDTLTIFMNPSKGPITEVPLPDNKWGDKSRAKCEKLGLGYSRLIVPVGGGVHCSGFRVGFYTRGGVNKTVENLDVMASVLAKTLSSLGIQNVSTYRHPRKDVYHFKIDGKKISGCLSIGYNSTYRVGSSIWFYYDYDTASKISGEDERAKVITVSELYEDISIEDIRSSFIASFEETLSTTVVEGELTKEENDLLSSLLSKYYSSEWTDEGITDTLPHLEG